MRHRLVKGKDAVLEQNKEFIVPGDPKEMKGRWHELFGNDHPIWLEIGSGKGQFLASMACLHPEINFLACEGIDDVYVRIVEKCSNLGLQNLILIPVFMDHSTDYFEDGELDRVFVNFCDPWPKKRHAKRRLTNRSKLAEYARITGSGHLFQFKTDNNELFEFSLEEIESCRMKILEMSRDLHNSSLEPGNIHTEYEDKFSAEGIATNYVLAEFM